MLHAFGYALFAIGALLSCVNFYLSFLRYLVFQLNGWKYRYISGIPVFGSLCLLIAAGLLGESAFWPWICLGIALIDTGGLHWLPISFLCALVFRRHGKTSSLDD